MLNCNEMIEVLLSGEALIYHDLHLQVDIEYRECTSIIAFLNPVTKEREVLMELSDYNNRGKLCVLPKYVSRKQEG